MSEAAPEHGSLVGIVFKVLLRGEFKLFPSLLLISVYGAAILVIPVVLNSLFIVSSSYIGFGGNQGQQALMLSVYNEVSSTYLFLEILLLVGLVITCTLSGMSVGRKARSSETLFFHLGVNKTGIRGSLMLVLLSLAGLASVLAFCIAIMLSSASLFVMSILFRVPETNISPGIESLLYLLIVFFASFGFLLLGWSRTAQKLGF
jgi:hypothetical protein